MFFKNKREENSFKLVTIVIVDFKKVESQTFVSFFQNSHNTETMK